MLHCDEGTGIGSCMAKPIWMIGPDLPSSLARLTAMPEKELYVPQSWHMPQNSFCSDLKYKTEGRSSHTPGEVIPGPKHLQRPLTCGWRWCVQCGSLLGLAGSHALRLHVAASPVQQMLERPVLVWSDVGQELQHAAGDYSNFGRGTCHGPQAKGALQIAGDDPMPSHAKRVS